MSIEEKTEEKQADPKISNLAVALCARFLREKEEAEEKHLEMPNTIFLNSHQPEVLESLKNEMNKYFRSKNKNVEIITQGKGQHAFYTINVGYYLY